MADVEVSGRRFPVVGFGGVIVNAQHRGRGLARTVVEAALEQAASMGPDFVLLFCHEDRVGLYRKLGFSFVRADVTVDQPTGPEGLPLRAMWRSLREAGQWPDGAVALHSLPF